MIVVCIELLCFSWVTTLGLTPTVDPSPATRSCVNSNMLLQQKSKEISPYRRNVGLRLVELLFTAREHQSLPQDGTIQNQGGETQRSFLGLPSKD